MSLQYYHTEGLKKYRAKFSTSENFALAACYFVPFESDGDNAPYKPQRNSEKLFRGPNYFKAMCDHAALMNEHVLSHLAVSGHAFACFTMKTEWRFLPGLGSAHIRETGLSLHHTYGLPWFSGSGCKGIARQAMLESLEQDILEQVPARENSSIKINLNCLDAIVEAGKKALESAKADAEKLAKLSRVKTKDGSDRLSREVCECIAKNKQIQDKFDEIRSILGNQEKKGCIVFMDAVPVQVSTAPCIMTPHQKNYYEKSSAFPSDADTPNILPMISVENAVYRFSLTAMKAKDGQKLLNIAVQYLKAALETVGAGAKSAVDYGYFKNYSDQTQKIHIQAEQNLRRKQEAAETPRQKVEALIKSSDFSVHAKGVVKVFTDLDLFSTEERPGLYRKLIERCLKEIKKLPGLQNTDYDKILVLNLLPKLSSDLKDKLAAELIKINRFKNKYYDFLSSLLPKRDYTQEAKGLIQVLSGSPSTADISRAKNLLDDKGIPGKEQQQIAQAILKIADSKNIKKKALEAARKTAEKYK